MLSGFLVVCEPRLSRNTGKIYAGVGRMPTYPSKIPGEESAMDHYVFGGVKDCDSNTIPLLGAAVRLCNLLSRAGRRFEIIFCRAAQQQIPGFEQVRGIDSLGYDVATVRTECWSIVDDICPSDWAVPYRQQLNKNGLAAVRLADVARQSFRRGSGSICRTSLVAATLSSSAVGSLAERLSFGLNCNRALPLAHNVLDPI
jgi:hypothetical protein